MPLPPNLKHSSLLAKLIRFFGSITMRDKEIEKLITAEVRRQSEGLEMIPSENHTSGDVLQALGSRLTDKYSEGYPGMRYYGGCENVDAVENLARNRAKKLFV